MILENSVLLLKSQKADSTDTYKELLFANGFNVKQVKSLIFNFKNLESLKEKLKRHDDYSGIIFSSPRCVHAVYLALKDEENIARSWQTKCNFVVGEATHKEALEKLHLDCQAKESGNAVNLSKVILKNKSLYIKPFLFPHGNLKTDTLSRELGKENINIEGILVYDTLSNPNIEKEIDDATDNFNTITEYVVFFSPSGLHGSLSYLRKVPDFCYAKLIAIGPVTELALREENLEVNGVTKNPTPQDVLELILK